MFSQSRLFAIVIVANSSAWTVIAPVVRQDNAVITASRRLIILCERFLNFISIPLFILFVDETVLIILTFCSCLFN